LVPAIEISKAENEDDGLASTQELAYAQIGNHPPAVSKVNVNKANPDNPIPSGDYAAIEESNVRQTKSKTLLL